MLIATGLTLLYRAVLFLNANLGWFPISTSLRAFMDGFDPAVFGVGVSCVAFGILALISRARALRAA
jgi:hypothetical protein